MDFVRYKFEDDWHSIYSFNLWMDLAQEVPLCKAGDGECFLNFANLMLKYYAKSKKKLFFKK